MARTRPTAIRAGGWALLCVALGASGAILLRDAFLSVLVWWFSLFLVGIAALPLTRAILGGFHDQGYPFSKAIGLGLVAYLSWLAASVGLLPLARWSTVFLVGGLAGAALSSRRRRSELARFVAERNGSIAHQECLFFALLASWAYVRGMQPDIHGLEKFMDHGFAASIVRSGFMPPHDMWLAGESVNYYYFGHYVLAFLSELSGVRLSIAYNLMIATLMSLCFTLTLSLAAEIARSAAKPGARGWLLAGTVSAALLTFGGNLHTFVFAFASPAYEGLRAGSAGVALDDAGHYSYVEATRYVGYRPPTADKTIHEFPLYSFVVSDLHAHVSNIPFVLSLLAILTAAFLAKGGPAGAGSFLGVSLPLRFAVAAAGALALSRITNAWDLPIYLCVTAAVVLARSLAGLRSLRQSLADTALTCALILVGCWALTSPFNTHFQNHYSELGWVHTHTPAGQALVLWGVPLLFVTVYGAAGLTAVRSKVGMGGVRHPLWAFSTLRRGDQLIVTLATCAVGLAAAPEIVYVRDIYGAEFYRANTYFKFGYQAFILFGVIIGCLAYRVITHGRQLKRAGLVRTLCACVLLLPLLYAPFAVRGYYGTLRPSAFKGLDGLAFLDRDGSGDGGAVRWLNENVSGSPVVLEASGDSFTDFGRVSMATGLPTILGWSAHEGLWRGSMGVPDRRARAVALVYESGNVERTLEILREYGVRFIVVGDLERRKFPNLDEAKLLGLGGVVFEAGGTRIIRVER
jgi:uncharacterized membrane protein